MTTHPPRITPLARTLLTLGATATGMISVAHADVQGLDLPVPVAQEPIGRSTGLAPNVLVMMDDSSSMTTSFMPANLGYILANKGSKHCGAIIPGKIPKGFSCFLLKGGKNYPLGHLYSGRLWYDTHHDQDIDKNTLRFEPGRVYLPWATGEARPAPGADLPRVQDSPRDLVVGNKRHTNLYIYNDIGQLVTQFFAGFNPENLAKDVNWWVKNRPSEAENGKYKEETAGTLPPLYVLRNNEQNIKSEFGAVSIQQDTDLFKVENYALVVFALDKNYNYHHTEVFGMTPKDTYDMASPITKEYVEKAPWPEDKEFVFIDKDGKTVYKGKPKELFQNYWNYLFYHSTRHAAARGGILEAFAETDEQLRVGFSTINNGGNVMGKPLVTPSRKERGLIYPIPVHENGGLFDAKHRSEFAQHVTNFRILGNTPLNYALHSAGQYYSDTTSKDSPYKDGNKTFSCRRNVTILVSDGYHNDNPSGWGDQDSTDDNDTLISANGARYRYVPSAPYQDGPGTKHQNTLADIAMYYWKRDLVPDSAGEAGKNNVPTTGRDPAFWQHMTTYGVSFGVGGTMDPHKVAAPGLPGSSTDTWPKPVSDDLSAADDLWHAAVNGHGQYYTPEDDPALSEALRAILKEVNRPGKGVGSTSAANAYLFRDTESGNVLKFSAFFNAADFSSNLSACKLDEGCEGGAVWDVSARLGELLAGNLGRERAVLFNAGDDNLQVFQWANLSSTQKLALASSDEELGKDTVRYLRGDTSLDGTAVAHPDSQDGSGALWRTRAELGGGLRNVLGMIVHGTPTFIGAPENIRTELASTLDGYDAFQKAHEDRPAVLYAAGNDGMVHAFITEQKSVSVNVGGINTTATYQPGDELFAFIPAAAVNQNMRAFTRQTFEASPHYLLDGELNYSEVKIGGEWKTILVGSMGAAGGAGDAQPSVFALDVTNPGTPKLLWEKTAPAMGQTMGRPVIAPVGNGKWSVFIGSGPNQSKTESKSAILQIDLETGSVTTLQGGGMASTSKGGILGLHVVDTDHDNYADTIYAGDLAGNVWKVSDIGASVQYAKLFTAPQPITAPLTSTVDKSGVRWLFFGTGKALSDADLTDKQSVRTWYGIQDTGAEVKDADLVSREYDVVKIRRTATSEEEDAVVMNYAITGDMDGKKGWKIPLNQASDAAAPGYMLLQNRVRSGLLVGQMNFAVSAEPSCDGQNATSRLMVIDPFTGSVPPDGKYKTTIDVNDDGEVDEKDLYSGGSSIGGGSGSGSGSGSGGVPIVGLGFGSGETSGSILIVQEQRKKTGTGTGTSASGTDDEIESTRSCAIDSNGVRVCMPPSPVGAPPTTHSWAELRNNSDDAP
ncbi:MAG: hypothetical protein IK051_05410 [Rhodocyclaceae bacterium]|nr:hypothetical protein [Rhodocyclaceae bacterium]MBR4737082.1 hypothetical protein [Rhodocyclaceae bacterium]